MEIKAVDGTVLTEKQKGDIAWAYNQLLGAENEFLRETFVRLLARHILESAGNEGVMVDDVRVYATINTYEWVVYTENPLDGMAVSHVASPLPQYAEEDEEPERETFQYRDRWYDVATDEEAEIIRDYLKRIKEEATVFGTLDTDGQQLVDDLVEWMVENDLREVIVDGRIVNTRIETTTIVRPVVEVVYIPDDSDGFSEFNPNIPDEVWVCDETSSDVLWDVAF